jgi:hypothetical protein
VGYDCTLHVVDEASLARFSAWFLRGEHADNSFAAGVEGPRLSEKTAGLLAEDSKRGACAVGELALMYVSAEAPHVYSRGFALSLWDDEVWTVPADRAARQRRE